MFNQKPREGVAIGKQIWDTSRKAGGISVEQDGETIRYTSASNWQGVLGKYPLKDISRTAVYWTITIQGYGSTPCIGVARGGASTTPNSYGCDYNSWILYGNGQKCTSSSPQGYCSVSLTTGSVVGVLCDLTKETVSFYINGVSYGTAFTISGLKDCYPFCCQSAGGDVYKADWKAKKPN